MSGLMIENILREISKTSKDDLTFQILIMKDEVKKEIPCMEYIHSIQQKTNFRDATIARSCSFIKNGLTLLTEEMRTRKKPFDVIETFTNHFQMLTNFPGAKINSTCYEDMLSYIKSIKNDEKWSTNCEF